MSGLHFTRPEYGAAVVLVAVWVWAYWRRQRGNGGWAQRVDSHLLSTMLSGVGGRARWPSASLALLGLILAAALAGPSWERSEVETHRDGSARVFLLDMSRSMEADDLKPSRFAQVRLKLLDLLAASEDRSVALLGFAAYPYTLTPLTDDINTLRLVTPLIQTNMAPAQGADIAAALARAAELLEQAFVAEGELILISDSAPTDGAVDLARQLARRGVRTSVIAVGGADSVAIPHGLGTLRDAAGNLLSAEPAHAALRALARAGDGEFVALSSGAVDVETVLTLAPGDERDASPESVATLWRDDGAWLLWLALLPILHLARRGVLC